MSLVASTSVANINNIISDVQVVLPGDGAMKKQRRQTVKLFQDRGKWRYTIFIHVLIGLVNM